MGCLWFRDITHGSELTYHRQWVCVKMESGFSPLLLWGSDRPYYVEGERWDGHAMSHAVQIELLRVVPIDNLHVGRPKLRIRRGNLRMSPTTSGCTGEKMPSGEAEQDCAGTQMCMPVLVVKRYQCGHPKAWFRRETRKIVTSRRRDKVLSPKT